MIVGIDPGTTTGIAILDVHGDVVDIFSARNMTKADVSRSIYKHGIPLVVSSDTFPAPRMVEKIASAFSARLVTPKEAMSIGEKIRLTKSKGNHVLANKHERDAFAAALFAHNQFKSLIRKIGIFLQRESERDVYAENFVIRKTLISGENIKNSIHEFKDIKQRDQL